MVPKRSLLLILLSATVFACASTRPQILGGSKTGEDIPRAIQVAGQTALNQKTLLSNLEHPWGLTWISDLEMLITERPGHLTLFSLQDQSSRRISGLPSVFASGQGGLLDIAAHPDFQNNRWVYFSYAQGDRNNNRTTVARAKLQDSQLSNWETVFSVADSKTGSQHFGSRLLWLPDQTLLISIGDGGNPPIAFKGELIRKQAQNLSTHFGKVMRINDDGTVPKDNPFVNQPNTKPEIWSYGHRNIQGMAMDSVSKQVWSTEHGSRGGDELNLMQSGQNYGWPLVSFSREYHINQNVAPNSSRPGIPDPKLVWTPSIAPSGLAVYRGDRYPGWDGHLLAGALVNQSVVRISVDQNLKTTELEEIPIGQRVREIKQGPDGYLYILTDSPEGRLLRLEPG